MKYTLLHQYIQTPAKDDLVFVFTAQEVLLHKAYHIPKVADFKSSELNQEQYYCFASLAGKRCLLLEAAIEPEMQQDLSLINLRHAFTFLDEIHYRLMLFAKHLAHWRYNSQFCGCCGGRMQDRVDLRARTCIACAMVQFPRISPSMIVLVTRGEKMLLARSPHFNPGVYSTLAGFIDPGETVEQAVHREVYEEVGVKIKKLQYQQSQPWPFPSALMLGYIAEYDSGELVLQPEEIEDAAWFSPQQLPALPSPASIGRKLIENHLSNYL